MNNKKFDFEELKKLFRTDIMPVDIVLEISKPTMKIEKVEDYYNFFVAMLHTEDARLHNMEHLWILGINGKGYSTCAYLVDYSHSLSFNYKSNKLLKTSLIHDCEKIILAYNKNTKDKIEITNHDIFFANYVYRRAAILGIELYDYIIISSAYHELSKTPKQPDYGSLRESHFMKKVINENIIDMDKAEHGYKMKTKGFEEGELIGLKQGLATGREQGKEEGQLEEKIQIAVNMLENNESIDKIIKYTGLTAEQIEKIKSEM